MRLFFSPSIDEREWHVWRPVIKLGEFRNQFFFYVDEEDTDLRELVVPPRGLYGKEFLALDYRDPFQLMAFQQKWGPITGLRTRPNTTFDYESYVDVDCLGGIRGLGQGDVPSGALQTIFLYKGYGKTDIVAKEKYGTTLENLGDIVQRHWEAKSIHEKDAGIVPCHVASVEEVAEAVCHAQIAITAITDCLRDDFDDENWHIRERIVRASLRYCNASIQGTVLPIDLIEDNGNLGVCTIMQYIFICMARGIMRNETYRNCQNPDCRQLFTPAEHNRRADSRYCSQECQVKAKHLRTYKPKRKAETPQPSNDPYRTDRLTLSWSESSFPICTLRRDTSNLTDSTAMSLSTAYTFNGLDCGGIEDEELIGIYKLEIPNPSARRALERATASYAF